MKQVLLIVFSSLSILSIAQQTGISIHEEQLNEYNALGNANAAYYEAMETDVLPTEKLTCNLDKVVYGWHPYWSGSAYLNYQWDLLSHMSFFSYEVNEVDGEPNSTHGWSTSAAVDAALNSGNTKVTLCVTLFSGHATFFGSPTAQQTLITNLINLVQSRGAHGVNIDFEGLPASQATNFANFMVDLCNQMHTAIPNSEVSTVLYAVDWSDVFDFAIMEPYVDHYIIMGYAYYYSGSGTAGPTDPLYHFGSTYNYTLSRSVTYYLDKGCPIDKLILGLPNYGYEWPTAGLTVPSATTGSGTARTYAYVKNNSSGFYSQANHLWETDSYTDVYAFDNGGTRQCMISLDSSWRKRLDHVRKTGIGGIGIWALGYDNGYTDLWDVMADYLTDCYEDSCSGEIHDFGGPTKNYYNDEDYTWTIEPPSASSLNINFSLFDVESNYDYLYVYDGDSDLSPQISGSPFTGVVGPGSFTTSTGAVTFRFTSDGATVNPGFLGTYTCNSLLPPVADFIVGNLEVCSGDSILLQNNSTDGDTYNWSTSAGGLSDSNAENTYLFPGSSGTYSITLNVNNAAGSDQITQQLNINVDLPNAAFATLSSTDVSLPNATVFFTNNSFNATSYYWDFGDGTTSIDQHPWHEYVANGVYNGFLVAANNGCPSDTFYFTVNVGVNDLTEGITNSTNVYPNPFNDQFNVKSDQEILGFDLLDIHGKKLALEWEQHNLDYTILTQNLAKGLYILRVQYGFTEEFVRLVKN